MLRLFRSSDSPFGRIKWFTIPFFISRSLLLLNFMELSNKFI